MMGNNFFFLFLNYSQFEDMAIGVMNVFDNNTRDSMNGVLMKTEVPFMKHDFLYFAVQCECKNFVALPSIQSVITDLWYGLLIHKAGTQFKLKVGIHKIFFTQIVKA